MSDENYINLTLKLAEKGRGAVSPNPLVGAVIVKDGRIIGQGYHEKFGEAHAEINAINSANESIEGATLYVNLEPCSHYGKTPPCADEIIKQKISKVVIGSKDPDPLVNGKGIERLRTAGIEVKADVLKAECEELNKFFFKSRRQNQPYVTLKVAQTIDGKIADADGYSKWITSEESRKFVHKMRSEYDAVLIGKNTALKDNPGLDVRLSEGRDPVRVILDKNLELDSGLKIFRKTDGKNIIVASENKKTDEESLNNSRLNDTEVLFVKEDESGNLNILDILEKLHNRGITSILVEGGGKVFSSFIRNKLFDEIYLFTGPKILGEGISSIEKIGIGKMDKAMELKLKEVRQIGNDALLIYRRE